MNEKDFWYIVAQSEELKADQVLARTVMGEWLALYRDHNGKAVVVQDRCLHRSSQLSRGFVKDGVLICSYHGWRYGSAGKVVSIPSQDPQFAEKSKRCATTFAVCEKDDYIYVCLSQKPATTEPFVMPKYKQKGYTTLRLKNLFRNNVTNCVENFVDIPHTTYVHPHIFRNPKGEQFKAKVERQGGSVKVTYKNETKNFGLFSFILNPKGEEIGHTDEFFMPNVTTVNYWFGTRKHFIITSQSVPISEDETLVYTDLTYNYGWWTKLSRPIVRWQAQAIIDQDVDVLDNQMKTIKKYGASFQNSPADVIHTYIESIRGELSQGRDPLQLPSREVEIEFWV